MRIGVFDSGIGGLTVVKELIKAFPHNSYFYLGDTANVPYGTKSPEKIKQLCQASTQNFLKHNLDLLVIACNTASALALSEIKSIMGNVPVIGVVEPGVQSVLEAVASVPFQIDSRVLILGTQATIRSGIYAKELSQVLSFQTISEQSCPVIVPLIEEGWVDTDIMKLSIEKYVNSYLKDKNPGVALLACTHYPWAQEQFQSVLKNWRVVNSAQAISRFIARNYPEIQNSKDSFQIQFEWTDPKSVSQFVINDFKNSYGINLTLKGV